jgi:signal transduction histidine kinase
LGRTLDTFGGGKETIYARSMVSPPSEVKTTLDDALTERTRRAVRAVGVLTTIAIGAVSALEIVAPMGANTMQRLSRAALMLLTLPAVFALRPGASKPWIHTFGILFPTLGIAHALFTIATSGGGASDQIAIFPVTLAAATFVYCAPPKHAAPLYACYLGAYVVMLLRFTSPESGTALANGIRWGVLGFAFSMIGIVLNHRTLSDAFTSRLALQEESRRATLATERTRISRDLHDHIGARLTGIALRAERDMERLPNEARETLEWMQDTVAVCMEELRDTIWALSSAGQDAQALSAILRRRVEDMTAAAGIALAWELDLGGALEPLSPGTSVALTAILREAVTNAVRHSAAKTLQVSLRREGSALRLEVADDGRGLPASLKEGRGLENMRARAREERGELRVEANGRGGVSVVVSLPVGA